MGWSTVQIEGKPVEVLVPAEPTPTTGVLLFLHGYDGVTLKDNLAFTQQLEKHQLIGICPLADRCWWTDMVYAAFDDQVSPLAFLADQIPAFCGKTWGINVPRIAVCGIEMGGQGALQLAYRHARQFQTVVAISPKVDFESWWGHGTSLDTLFADREAARQRTATLQIHPLNYPKHQFLFCDPADHYCIDGVLTLASKLSSTGIPFDHDFQSSFGGYGWAYANAVAPRAIEYVASRLKTIE